MEHNTGNESSPFRLLKNLVTIKPGTIILHNCMGPVLHETPYATTICVAENSNRNDVLFTSTVDNTIPNEKETGRSLTLKQN